MQTRYCICGLGYDEYDCITDYEQDFGNFDTYEEAYEEFVKLQCKDLEWFFKSQANDYQMLLQLEECKETDDAITCIDVKNEWWIINPNFNVTFMAFAFDEYHFIANRHTCDSKEEAISFAKSRNWDGVMDDITGEIVWER